LIRNGVCTAIDDLEIGADQHRLTVQVGSILHEFPGPAEFGSFVAHLDDYLDSRPEQHLLSRSALPAISE
jgi:hypothetical protein